jgi:nucleotide-binding universal stress UspA family protein
MVDRAGRTRCRRPVAEAKGTGSLAEGAAQLARGRANMAYKDILVYLDPTVETVERIRLAVSLAKTNGVRLIGVDVSAPPAGQEAEAEQAISRTVSDTTRESGLTTVYAPANTAEESENFTHCVDLMIAPGPESLAQGTIRRATLDRALFESGAPMLMLPPEWKPGPVGDNIVIAWNAGREALRAVHDAMPLLERAKKVTLFAFSSRPSALRKSAEILVDHLAAHGVKAEDISDWTNTGDLTAVEALFASLDTQDADLIVAGAFGHSRIYEGLFGGVTLDLMHQQSVPVLMSH